MLSLASRALVLVLPYVVLPLLLGTVLFGIRLGPGLHWWTGFLLLGLCSVLAHALGADLRACGIAGIALIVGAAAWRSKAMWRALRQEWPRVTSMGRTIVLVAAAALTVAGLVQITMHPLTSDALVIWLSKTKAIYAGLPYSLIAVRQYPSLVPTFEAFAMKLTGQYQPDYAAYLGPIAYFFWALSLLSLTGRNPGWVLTAILSSVSILMFGKPVVDGYQDVYIMMVGGLAALVYVRYLEQLSQSRVRGATEPPRLLFWLGASFSGMLGLIKSEGAVLGLILMFCALLCIGAGARKLEARWWRKYLAPSMLGVVLLLIWPAILLVQGVDLSSIQGSNITTSTILAMPQHVAQLPMIWPYFAQYMQQTVLLLGAALVLSGAAWATVPQRRPALAYLWLAWCLHTVFVFSAFLASQASLEWHLSTAFERLSDQHAFVYPLALVVAAEALLSRISADERLRRVEA